MTTTCWNCGAVREADSPSCADCGLRLSAAADPDIPSTSSTSPADASQPARVEGDPATARPAPWVVTAKPAAPPAARESGSRGKAPTPAASSQPPPVPPGASASNAGGPTPPISSAPWSKGRSRTSVASSPVSPQGPGRAVDTGDLPVSSPSWLSSPSAPPPTGRAAPPPGPMPPTGPRAPAIPSGSATPAATPQKPSPTSGHVATPPSGARPPQSPGHTGYVQGQVLEERRDIRFWGGRALLAALVVTVVVGLVHDGPKLVNAAFGVLMPLVIFAALLLVIPKMLGKGGGFASGVFSAGAGVARGAAGFAKAGLNGARSSTGALARSGSSPFSVTIRRFRIQDATGHDTSCVLIGDVHGDLMRQGDLVRVEGHKNRDGVVQSRVVRVLDKIGEPPRTTVRGRQTSGFLIARVADAISKVLALGLIIYTVVILMNWRA